MKNAKLYHGWWVVGAAFVTVTLSCGTRFSFAIFYPKLLHDFGWSNATIASIASLNILTYAFSAPLVGGMVDRLGPKKVILTGALLLGLGMALIGAANTVWHFYLLYGVVVALGSSLTGIVPNVTVVSRCFSGKSASVPISIVNSGFAGGIVLSLFAQWLLSAVDWRNAYVIFGLLAPIVIFPLVFATQGDKLLEGKIRTSTPTARSPSTFSWLRTLRSVSGNYQFWLLGLISFSSFGVFASSLLAHQVNYTIGKGYAPALAALALTIFGIVQGVGNNTGGIIVSRIGRERSYTVGWVLTTIGMVSLLSLGAFQGAWPLYAWAILAGLGYGMMASMNNVTTVDLFQGENLGLIFGLITAMFGIGGALGPWLFGIIVDATGSYTGAFVMGMGSLTIALVAMWVIAPRSLPGGSAKATPTVP